MNKVYLIPKYQVGAKTVYNAYRGYIRRIQSDMAQGPRTLTMSPEERRRFEEAKRNKLKRTHKKQYKEAYQKRLEENRRKEAQRKEQETRTRLEIGSNLIQDLQRQLDNLGVPYNPNASLGELWTAVLENQEALTNYLHDGVYNPVFKRFDVTVKLPEEYRKFLDSAREEDYYPGFMQDLEKYANYYRNQDVAGVLRNYSDADVALNGPYLLDAAYAQMGESAGDWEHQAHNPEGIYYGDPDNYQKAMRSEYGKQMANRSSLENVANWVSPGQMFGAYRQMAEAGDFNPLMYLIPGYGAYKFATDGNVRQALWDSILYGNSGWVSNNYAFRHPQAANLWNIGLDFAVPWAVGKGAGLIARGAPRLQARFNTARGRIYDFLANSEFDGLSYDEMSRIAGGGDWAFSDATAKFDITTEGKVVRTKSSQRPSNKQMSDATEAVINDYAAIQERLPQDLQTEYNNILNGSSEMQQVKAAKEFNKRASAYIAEHIQDFEDVLPKKPSLAPRQTPEPTVTPNNPVTPEPTPAAETSRTLSVDNDALAAVANDIPNKDAFVQKLQDIRNSNMPEGEKAAAIKQAFNEIGYDIVDIDVDGNIKIEKINSTETPRPTGEPVPEGARPTEETPARPAEEGNAAPGEQGSSIPDDDLSTEPTSQTDVPENNPAPAESGTASQHPSYTDTDIARYTELEQKAYTQGLNDAEMRELIDIRSRVPESDRPTINRPTQQPSQSASESSQAAPTESTPARSESAANGESTSTSGNTGETSLDNPGQKYGLTKEQYEDYVALSEKGGFRQRKLNRAEKLRYEDYEAKVKAVSQNKKPKLASKIKGITPFKVVKGYGKTAALAAAVVAPLVLSGAALLAGKDAITGVNPGDRYKRAAKKAQMENEIENSKVNMEILNKTKELNKQAEDMQKQMEAMQPKDEIIGYEYDANGNIIGQQVKTANGNIKVIPIAPIDTAKVNQESKAYEGEFRQE